MLLRNQRLYYAHGLLCLILLKQRRSRNATACLIHVLHSYARGINMRHIVATLYVAALLKCRKSGAYTSLDVRHRVVPTCLTCNFECRTTHTLTLTCKALYGLPHLLYLTNTEFCLIEQNEMLVKVVVAVQNKALCRKIRVASCTSCLLHVVLKRI